MPIGLSIETSGIKEAVELLNNFKPGVYQGVEAGLAESAVRTRAKLNMKVEEYQGQAEIYKISWKEVDIGPSLELIEELGAMPKWIKEKYAERICIWRTFKQYRRPSERLPPVGTAINKVRSVALEMVPIIKAIMIKSIKEKWLGR